MPIKNMILETDESKKKKDSPAVSKEENKKLNTSENVSKDLEENQILNDTSENKEDVENKSVDKIDEKEDKYLPLPEEVENNAKNNKKSDFKPVEDNSTSISSFSAISLFFLLILVILLLAFSVFTVYNTTSQTIPNGVFIKDVDVSGLSKESALNTLNTYISEHSSEEIALKHEDYTTSLSTSQINAKFDVESAVNEAYDLNKNGNIFENSINALKLIVSNKNIDPKFTVDEEQLKTTLDSISANLPDTVIESSYYIEDNALILTAGRTGCVVDVDKMKSYVMSQIKDLDYRNKSLNIIVTTKNPTTLDIDAIYKEIHKDPVDAYFTQDPYALYPSEEGLDFAISLDEAKALIASSNGEERQIPLKVVQPNVTTNMLGNEAFPDVLSTYSTRYAVSNTNRTTNLILAANKINGTVLMPGETFSYNKTVGERTIAEGYKEAPIYVDGKTVDGLGGGICQISTTLYEAALYANLQIVERLNHQFVPSYVGPGLDATVVYGLTDFKFTNNRNYPIKLICSVEGGIANFQILGLATPDDYEVVITANSSKTATSINSVTYKTLKQNGQVVSQEVISRDTYKRH